MTVHSTRGRIVGAYRLPNGIKRTIHVLRQGSNVSVIDRAPNGEQTTIEVLRFRDDDGMAQALAVAHDYVDQAQAYAAGRRDHPPARLEPDEEPLAA